MGVYNDQVASYKTGNESITWWTVIHRRGQLVVPAALSRMSTERVFKQFSECT
jgi:hypothetical protein